MKMPMLLRLKNSSYAQKVCANGGKYELCGTAVAAILQKKDDKKIKRADPNVKQRGLHDFGERSADSAERYLGKYHVVHSSGSTGMPKYFVYDEQAWKQVVLGVIRGALWDLSFRSMLKLFASRPRILYIAATDGRYGGAMAVHDGIQGVRAEQRFSDQIRPDSNTGKKTLIIN